MRPICVPGTARRLTKTVPSSSHLRLPVQAQAKDNASAELDIDALISDTDAMDMLRRSILGQMREVESSKTKDDETPPARALEVKPAAKARSQGGVAGSRQVSIGSSTDSRAGSRPGSSEGRGAGRDPRGSRDIRDGRDSRDGRGGRDSRDGRDGRDSRGGRNGRDRRDTGSGRRQSASRADMPIRDTVIPISPGASTPRTQTGAQRHAIV